ncbi:MAG: Ig-like domain-containing protein, partial [Verrucomicrobiota bacterium]
MIDLVIRIRRFRHCSCRSFSGWLLLLLLLLFETRAEAVNVANTMPVNGTNDSSIASIITVTFDQPVDLATVNSNSFIVSGERVGIYPGIAFPLNATQVSFAPNLAYAHGERITVDLTAGIQNVGNTTNLMPYQFQFNTETFPCGPNMAFFDSGQTLGAGMHRGLTLGDV